MIHIERQWTENRYTAVKIPAGALFYGKTRRRQEVSMDLADLHEVEKKILKRNVRRQIEWFPEIFIFELAVDEFRNLRNQFDNSSWGGMRCMPMTFTKQGVAMLSGIVNSKKAVNVNIHMRAFMQLRNYR